ncbi:hypothetical protein DL96DRAFT_158745 [Flagelloscypha sp. PMI_526]|nr:hypothetical protein DL96DRAFT_158745 [Flagelloscypha sp. PMI_526]
MSLVPGNASDSVKDIISQIFDWHTGKKAFGSRLIPGLIPTEVSISELNDRELTAVFEKDVTKDMLNNDGHVTGGCYMTLVDLCTGMVIQGHLTAVTGAPKPGVSLSLSIVVHHPAVLGDRLRIISRTSLPEDGTYTAQTEVWSVNRHFVVATGTHINVTPSTSQSSKPRL